MTKYFIYCSLFHSATEHFFCLKTNRKYGKKIQMKYKCLLFLVFKMMIKIILAIILRIEMKIFISRGRRKEEKYPSKYGNQT